MAEKKVVKTYTGVVDVVPRHPNGDLMGHIYVLVDDVQRHAYLPSSFKAVQEGDTVTLEKSSMWKVVAVHTYHPPPKVTASMGTPPSAATTVSGTASKVSTDWNVAAPPAAPSDPSGNSNNQLYTRLIAVTSHLRRLESWLDNQIAFRLKNRMPAIAAAVNDHATQLTSTQQALNSNASKLNQAVDYAGTASDAIGGVVGALKKENIVK